MQRLFTYIFLCSILFSLTLSAKSPAGGNLPVDVPSETWCELRDGQNDSLQQKLSAALSHKKSWKRLIALKKLAVGIVDLSDPMQPRFASVNGDEMMYAASLPKIAVLLAASQAMEEGKLADSPENKAELANMIRFSSNTAASKMIDFLGLDSIANVLQAPKYKLYDPAQGGGLWVGRKYAKRSKRNPDPLQGLSHAATVTQVCRFYYLLATGRLVNAERSKEMLEMMCEPGIHHKFVGTLEKVAPNAKIYRKSGTWRNWHSDSALVWETDGSRRYILVGMTESPKGGKILSELAGIADKLLRK